MKCWLFIACVACVLVTSCVARHQPEPSQVTANPSAPAERGASSRKATPAAVLEQRRPSGPRLKLLDLQAEYLKEEGVNHRGPKFEKLVNSIRYHLFVGQGPPITELEILELLGPPDYGVSDGRGAELAYKSGGGYLNIIEIGPDGVLWHVFSHWTTAQDLAALPRWHPFLENYIPPPGSGYLGIALAPQTLHPGDVTSVLVGGIAPNGPASHSGIRAGDRITAIDDKPIPLDGIRGFMEQVAALPPGKIITLKVSRPGKDNKHDSIENVKVTVGSRPPAPVPDSQPAIPDK